LVKERNMKNARMIPAMGIAALFLGLLAACPSPGPDETGTTAGVPPEPARPEPAEDITVRLVPGSLLESNMFRRIERDNAELLGHLRKYRVAAPEDRPSAAKAWKATMKTTYLKDARMTLESGQAVREWEAIIETIQGVLDTHDSFKLKSVLVEIEYLPYGSEKYVMLNADKKPGEEIDMIFHIKSTIVHESDPLESQWDGELLHRRTCDPLW
jgi:hypothetical protein